MARLCTEVGCPSLRRALICVHVAGHLSGRPPPRCPRVVLTNQTPVRSAGSITGKVVYGTPGNNTGCDPITPDPAWGANPVIMVDRGDCMFAAKARNAELAGAAAVIIINNVPLCGPASDGGSPGCESCANCCSYNCAPTACTCRLPYMVRARPMFDSTRRPTHTTQSR